MRTTPTGLLADAQLQLAAFLRARRAALNAADVALPARPARRRTPGLRREEVAWLAGISTTWYTWLEQGRDIALSGAALARLAEVLQLSPAERGYLFELARRRDPTPHPADTSLPLRQPLDALVDCLTLPAYLLDPNWHRAAWNTAAMELFAPWRDSGEPNLLRYMFLDPGAPHFISEWPERAQRMVAEFRADTALRPDDAGLAALVAELQQRSAPFAQYWNQHQVLAREGGRRCFNHPVWGAIERQQVTLLPATHPEYKLVLLMPSPDIVMAGD